MTHSSPPPNLDQVDPALRSYIETSILPQYAQNEWGHQINHINYVIRRSFQFASQTLIGNTQKSPSVTIPLDPNIIYTVAAFHDLGHHIDVAHHEIISAALLREDPTITHFFSPADLETIAEAIEDHRSHQTHPPRSIYGKIVASADCNINIDVMLRRTYTYRLRNFQNLSLGDIIHDSRRHLIAKYGQDGYARDKMFFNDPEFTSALHDLQNLVADASLFRQRFLAVNHLERAYLCDQQLSRYLKSITPALKSYIEASILPQYIKNDRAHGLLHIREVIRRSFVLNDTFTLQLNPNLIYTIAAFHDLGKHINSDRHEFISADLFRQDSTMSSFFSPADRVLIAEAIEDHRSSKSDSPRSTYGRLISSADRNTRVELVFIRSFFVGKDRQPDTIVSNYLDYTFRRLSKRYSEDDPENMFYADSEYRDFLSEIRTLLRDESAFRERYIALNQITSLDHPLFLEPGVETFLV